MTLDDVRTQGIDAILREADTDALAARVDRLVASRVSDVEGQEAGHVAAPAREGAGAQLAERLSPASQKRYRMALLVEQTLFDESAEADFGSAIFIGCQIVEEHLRALFAPLSQRHLPDLVDRVREEGKLAAVIEGWAKGTCPMTLGVLQILMMAHRRWLDDAGAREPSPLGEALPGDYLIGFRAKGPERAIGSIRDRFRNPVAHGTSTFAAEPYADFARLLVGADRIGTWDREGPNPPAPPIHLAVLHHHLRLPRA